MTLFHGQSVSSGSLTGRWIGPLHHVLIYHELGHAVYSPIQVQPPPELDPSNATTLSDQLQKAASFQFYYECMSSWIEEIFADTVGVLLAGPAYAIAFSRFLGTFFSLWAATRSHPPIALRIELIQKVVTERSYDIDLDEEGKALLSDWASDAAMNAPYRTTDLKLKSILSFLVRDLRACRATILGAASAAVGRHSYDPADIPDDMERGKCMYSLAIPAIETDTTGTSRSEPLAPARIFSSGWMAYLHAVRKEQPSRLPEAAHHIAEVILGSLEGSHALRAWEKHT